MVTITGYLSSMDGGEFEHVSQEFNELKAKFNDPLVIGTMLHRLAEERQSTNLLLREINAKLDKISQLETKIAQLETNAVHREEGKVLLPEVDQEIIIFIKKKGAVCAEDVQGKFEYKGKNAASSRLNKLCALGVVKKTQVGKKVYFEVIK